MGALQSLRDVRRQSRALSSDTLRLSGFLDLKRLGILSGILYGSIASFVTLGATAESSPNPTPTYFKDVEPLIHLRCAPCHRPDQAAPFSLLTYSQVKSRSRQIAEVTASRYMPPWPPSNPPGELTGDRRLTDAELSLLQNWMAQGMPEGERDPATAVAEAAWSSNWQLGTPDLVVEAPEYMLGPEGRDLYRNFVVPIPTEVQRYVRGVEFRPGNARVVHHAFVQIDETRQSRRKASAQTPPGFDGMDSPETAVMPGGQLLGFQPGKTPSFSPPGLAWELKPGSDLVLQVHMNRTGKPEPVRPSVAFYFTDQPPTNRCFRLKLAAFQIDVPPGDASYRIRQSYVLPVAVRVLRLSAHAHYLGKNLQGYAVMPDGSRRQLLTIPDWDFKWQGDYGFVEPVRLEKGSVITLDYGYDNSASNPRNPHAPPQRVRWGLQSVDEMGELTLQVLPDSPEDWKTLAVDYARYFLEVSAEFYRFRIGHTPTDAEAHARLGRLLASQGRADEALVLLREAIRLDPKADAPHFDLGTLFLNQEKLTDAYEAFRQAAKLNPMDSQAFGSLGIIALRSGKVPVAKAFLERALQLNPDDTLARQYLEAVKEIGNRKAP